MRIKESDIIFETDNGVCWVLKEKDCYTVMMNKVTHSISESSYPLSADGLSIAITRANYIDKRKTNR